MKYNPLPIQKRQHFICTFVYCENMAECFSQVCNYLVSCKWPKLAVLLLHHCTIHHWKAEAFSIIMMYVELWYHLYYDYDNLTLIILIFTVKCPTLC